MEQVTIRTPFGDTTLWKTGRGPLMLVLHGGPGMDHCHLVDTLQEYGELRTLLFFDQLGCGGSRQNPNLLTAETTLRHVEAITFAVASPASDIGVFAHSWGTHLALELLLRKTTKFSELILVSPFPLNTPGLEQSSARLSSKIPPSVAGQLSRLEGQSGTGSKIMELLLPFYVTKTDVQFPPEIVRYDPLVNEIVLNSLGSFDTSPAIRLLPSRSIVVRGAEDFVTRDSVLDILGTAGQAFELPDVGHFPFFENRVEFARIMRSFLL